ncbi:MAG: NFACT RNA binding domain-containing protein, partial [Halobacteriota archaeon]
LTTDDFLVIGGRNARQNEALIDRYAEPDDRVFHSQAHGGPVTLVKATAPDEPRAAVEFPQTTVEQAAQFAVSYSSVWKDGHYTGDVYAVDPDQMTKQAESGEYLATGAFAVRGDRDYLRDVPVGVAIGVMCEPETRVIGGPPAAIVERSEVHVELEPGRFAQADVAKRIYRRFQAAFADQRFVRSITGVDDLQGFLPPGGSRIVDGD